MAHRGQQPDAPKGRIRGGFPGGPTRPEGEKPVRTHWVRSMDEVEERIRRHRLRAREGRRRSAALRVLVASMVVSGGVGVWLGALSHRTQSDLTAEAYELSQLDSFISREVNRTLLQLWRMEDVEAMRNRGRTR